MAHLIMLPVLFLVMISTVAPQTTTGPLYPMGKNTAFGPRDDGSSPPIELKRPFIYFGEIYRYIYINVNGYLTFEMDYDEYDPLRFPLYGSFGIIAPFWTDLNSQFGGAVYSDQYTNGSVLPQATEDINEYFPGLNFTASWVLVATWNNVPFYSYTSIRATFQAVLISGDEYSFLLLNYGMINSIPYDVQAGYDTVNSTHHFILPGSFARSTPTDSPSFHLSSNVNETGRWAFKMGKGCSFNGDLILPGTSFWSDGTCAQKCDCSSEGLRCHDQPCPYSQICQPSNFQFSCQRDESNPCKNLDCREHERCGEKDGVYDCLCDENHQRPDNETYESTVTCAGSSAYITVSRCQLFEDGFHSSALHLQDESCKGQLQDGRLLFHFNNEDQLCGTGLKSNGTHFIYENSIQGHVDPNKGPISRRRNIQLNFFCAYPLNQSLSMDVGIRPIESMVNRNLPSANGSYRVTIVPYQDPEFKVPLTSERNIEIEISDRLFMEVRLEGVDEHQISIVVDSCWATPVDNASFPVRWDLISHSCPNPADDSVEILHNGGPLAARFSFKMFTFIDFSSIYLHCKVHLCLLEHKDCTTPCSPDSHTRRRREVTYHDTTDISVGPLVLTASGKARGRREVSMEGNSASGQLTSMVILLLSLLTATTLT